MDITVGNWTDNRIGVNRAMRAGRRGYGGTAYGDKANASLERNREYDGTINPAYKAKIDFFETGIVPVTANETLEILAFMEAADESKDLDGREVFLQNVMQRAVNHPSRLKF